VALIKAVGGGWDASRLASAERSSQAQNKTPNNTTD
jgi:hypothetical protein